MGHVRSRQLASSSLLALTIGGLVGAGAACAQQGTLTHAIQIAQSSPPAVSADTPPAPSTAAPGVATGLAEVVVTARRRVESVQNIPVAVTALSAQQLQRYDLTSLDKVAAATPEFTVGHASNGSGAQLTLRGIGSSSTSIGIEQSVGVVVDGVYFGQGRVIEEGFFDLSQLEILKGPQALFFGKNATAGVISITSADPTSTPEFMGRIGYETNSEQVYGEAVVSGPVTDTLKMRLAVRGSDMFGGYFKNGAQDTSYTTFDIATGQAASHDAPAARRDQPEDDSLLGRLTLLWTPTDHFTATFKGTTNYNTDDNNSYNYVAYNCAGGVSSLNPADACGRRFVTYQNNLPADISATLPFGNPDGALGNRYRSYSGTVTLNYQAPTFTVTSVNNINYNDNTFNCDCDFQSSDNQTFATERTSFRAYSTELRGLTTFHDPFNVLVGVLYQNSQRRFSQNIAFAGLSDSAAPEPGDNYVALQKHSSTEGETISAYGQLIWTLTRQIELTGGARYTYETKDSQYLQPYVNPALTGLFIPANSAVEGQTSQIDANQLFHNVSPEATITYRPTNNITAYVAYKTGYKSGGFSNSGILGSQSSVHDFAFNPETAKGYEAGVKTTLFDRQLRTDLTAYHYRFSNLQVDFFNSPTFAFITDNAGSAITNGVEFNAEYAPRQLEGLLLHGSLNYNHAYYGSFIAPCWSGQTPAQGCTLTAPAPDLTPSQDLAGHSTALAPKWTASLGANYDYPLASRLVLGLSADTRYNDSYNASQFGNPYARQPSYVNIDAALRLHTLDNSWEFALIAKNLSNNFVVTGGIDGPSTGGGTATAEGVRADQIGFVDTPRTIQLQVTWRH